MTTVGMWANFIPVIRGIATGANLLLFFLGAILAVSGKLHAGDILVFGVAMGAILSRLQQINTANNMRAAYINGIYQPLLGVVGFLGKVIILLFGTWLVFHTANGPAGLKTVSKRMLVSAADH